MAPNSRIVEPRRDRIASVNAARAGARRHWRRERERVVEEQKTEVEDQVLAADETPIPGLYAVGNDRASIMGGTGAVLPADGGWSAFGGAGDASGDA